MAAERAMKPEKSYRQRLVVRANLPRMQFHRNVHARKHWPCGCCYGIWADDYLQTTKQPKFAGTKTFLGSAGFDVHCPNWSLAVMVTLCEQAWFVWHKFAQKQLSMHVFYKFIDNCVTY